MTETTHTPRITNYRTEVYDIIQSESARRRNGGKGFSQTVNQIVLEWLDYHLAAEGKPADLTAVQAIPAVHVVTHHAD